MSVELFINVPRQDRSIRSHNRILDAASALLEEAGFDEISVAQICSRAKLSTGAFYARFTSKKAVLYAIQARYMTQLRADIGDILAVAKSLSTPLPDAAREIFFRIASGGLATRGVMHAVTSESTRDAHVMMNIADFSNDLAATFCALDAETTDRADMAFATRACIATLQQEWLYPERLSDDGLDALADRLARLLVGYVNAR